MYIRTYIYIHTHTHTHTHIYIYIYICKSKDIPRQAEVALGVPGRLRPWIFSTFGTTRVVGRQPNAPAAFPPGYSFSEAESTLGHMVLSEGTTEKIPSDITGDFLYFFLNFIYLLPSCYTCCLQWF